ncbi:MAG TPA: hypothetical protein VEA69_12515, partial [Tepidisphaeraceae bacterium]|nr:hypothetical protein [Tepidisphaeraceae bacterium]
FALDETTGRVLFHVDLAAAVGLPFSPGFWKGGVNLASLAADGDVLIVSFEERVLALDTRQRKVLWHLRPDTFPNNPFPVAHDGVLYMTVGDKATDPAAPKE